MKNEKPEWMKLKSELETDFADMQYLIGKKQLSHEDKLRIERIFVRWARNFCFEYCERQTYAEYLRRRMGGEKLERYNNEIICSMHFTSDVLGMNQQMCPW